jgi:transposase
MRFYNKQHKFYCGIDLHARKMYVCIIDQEGKTKIHQNMRTDPEILFDIIFPFLEDVVICVECMFSWYWIADFCAEHKIPFVLGHALYMKAIHGGKTKNDKIDSYKIAKLLRGGNLPLAYPYPAKMRATRDLLRRRTYMVRQCGLLLAHIQNTNTQYNLPAFKKNISRKYNHEGVADRFEDPATKASVDADLTMIEAFNTLIKKLEWQIEKTARQHNYHDLYLLRSIPRVGQILALVILYEVNTIKRFPTVQNFSSYCRLIRPEKESDGKWAGKSNKKIGNAHLKWAIREAAMLFLRESEEAKRFVDKSAAKSEKGKALGIFTHKLGRSIYFMLKNKKAFDMKLFFSQ